MKILNILNEELVEVFWVDDNEIEYVPIDEFIKKYGKAKLEAFRGY